MKKILSLMLGMSLALGVVAFAADEKPMEKPMEHPAKEKKMKKAKKETAPKHDEKK